MNQINKEQKIFEKYFWQVISAVIFAPPKAMEWVCEKPQLKKIIGFILFSAVILFALQKGSFEKIAVDTLQNHVVEETNQNHLDSIIAAQTWGALFISFFYFVATPFLKAFVVHGITKIFSGPAPLKITLSVILHSYVIMVLGQIIRVAFVFLYANPYWTLSLAGFLQKEAVGSPLFSILAAFDVFSIWYLFVSAVGISRANDFKRLRGMAVAFSPWMVSLILGILGLLSVK